MKKRSLSVVALCLVLSTIPLVLSLGIVDVSELTENLQDLEPTSSTTTVLIEPDEIIKDYILDPGYQINDTFQIHVNVSDVTDLYTWNVNVSWNPDILNFTRIVSYGDLLNQTSSTYGTSRMVDLINANNEIGWTVVAETILGDYSGVSGNARMITIEFLIDGYGSTHLNLSVTESAPTILLNSLGSSISFTTVDGYFSNRLFGDITGDGNVDIFDLSKVAIAYFTFVGDPNYDPDADINNDGMVDIRDLSVVAYNYGRTIW